MNSFSSQLLMLYFDHCARRDYNDSAAARQAVSTGGKHATRPLFPSTGRGDMQMPGVILGSTEQVPHDPVAAPVLPVTSSTGAPAASRTTGSSSWRERSSYHLQDREGYITVVRLQLTLPPCAGTAGKSFSPGGNLMSIWG